MIAAWRCRRWNAALVDYADGSLEADARAHVEHHLVTCARCTAALASLTGVAALLRDAPVARDEAFWIAQRQATMRSINAASAERAEVEERTGWGFDLRLALPVAVAAVIALAGYLSLRPPAKPGEMALNTLGLEDLTVLSEVAEEAVGPSDGVLDLNVDAEGAAAGAFEAGWVRADQVPGWGELDDDELETLNGIIS
jgi:hypothetical protein